MLSSARISRALPWALLGAALLFPVAIALRGSFGDLSLGRSGGSVEPLPDYGVVPDFSLIERSGLGLRRADLAGEPWVANFIFTRCQGTCPVLTSRMAKLDKALGGRVRLVSFSVDPRHDTPQVLSEYAGRTGASERWLFVTGQVAEVRSLITGGFHLSATEAAEPDDGGAITHSDRIALVDRDLRIRRYYLGTEEGWMDEVVRDLEGLAR